jgi:hypothetical protein
MKTTFLCLLGLFLVGCKSASTVQNSPNQTQPALAATAQEPVRYHHELVPLYEGETAFLHLVPDQPQ